MKENKLGGIILFENYHQRKNIGGSRIRGHWIIKAFNKLSNEYKLEEFVQGKDYSFCVYQKVYWKEHARNFKGIKILDLCDPDWLDGAEVIGLLKYMDAITVSTEKLKEEVEKFTDKPVYYIKDRIDFDTLNAPKRHKDRARKVCWFGYSGNSDVLDPTLMKLRNMGLGLKVISDGAYMSKTCSVENVKWDIETVNDEIQECDFCLLPENLFGRYQYKSQNKTEQSWALGMPVAKTVTELEKFIDPKARQKEADKRYKWVMKNCDVKDSAKELMEIIKSL